MTYNVFGGTLNPTLLLLLLLLLSNSSYSYDSDNKIIFDMATDVSAIGRGRRYSAPVSSDSYENIPYYSAPVKIC